MTTLTLHDGGRRWRLLLWAALLAFVLLAPLIGMRYSTEIAWSASDFASAGGLVTIVAVTFELVARGSNRLAYRAGLGVALAAAFGLIWINAAVGIIGSERDDANALFALVPAVAIAGAAFACLQAPGMARAMIAAAVVQIAIAAVAVTLGWGAPSPGWPFDILGVTAILATLWLVSAALFGRAARARD